MEAGVVGDGVTGAGVTGLSSCVVLVTVGEGVGAGVGEGVTAV